MTFDVLPFRRGFAYQSALSLFVARILANDQDDAPALDDFAMFANLFY